MENMNDYIDKVVVEVMDSIKHNEVTILTGRNAGGKSLIRKQLIFQIASAVGKDYKKTFIPQASQEIRTASQPSMGALSGVAHDLEWLATSTNTLYTLEHVFAHRDKADYIVIDEPEIGMGEELQLGIADYLNDEIAKVKALGKGCLIICHSRLIAQNVVHDNFINMEGMSEDEWLNRIPKKISITEFKEFSDKLFETVRDRQNANRKKN